MEEARGGAGDYAGAAAAEAPGGLNPPEILVGNSREIEQPVTGIRDSCAKSKNTSSELPGRQTFSLKHRQDSRMVPPSLHPFTVDPREVANVVRTNYPPSNSRKPKLFQIALPAHFGIDDGEYIRSRSTQGHDPI